MKKEYNTVEEIIKRINKIKKQSDKLDTEFCNLQEKLIEICPHSETIEKTFYCGGSYLDKSYTESWQVCKICRKQMTEKTISYGSYG